MFIRTAEKEDLDKLLDLYTHLNDDKKPLITEEMLSHWSDIINDRHQYILVAEIDGEIICSVTVSIIKNITRGMSSYALIENVVTHPYHRKKGYAKDLMKEAIRISKERNCYKIMLLTGSKEENVHKFYESCGFNRKDKTGFVFWI